VNDDRLASYLSERAATIPVPPGDPAAIVRRATRRRRRRGATVGVAATLVLALVAVAAGVLDRGGQNELEVAAPGATVVESPFEWTEVDVDGGLGWARAATATADGSVYSLSTAPGATTVDAHDPWEAATLYRSTDGLAWEAAALPDDLWAASLAARGDRLYALGTAPASAGAEVVLASNDGDAWEQATIDVGVADLFARFGDEVQLTGMHVADGPGGPVVAVVVRALLDLDERLPADVAANGHWQTTSAGVDVMGMDPACTVPTSTVVGEDGAAPSAQLPTLEEQDQAAAAIADDPDHPCAQPVVEASFTWADLGVPADLAALVDGQIRVVAPDEDGAGDVVEVPVEGSLVTSDLVALDDGLALVVSTQGSLGDRPSQQVLRSADGVTWEADLAAALPGHVTAVGELGGRLAVVASDGGPNGAELRVADGSGGWSRTELLPDQVGPGPSAGLGPVAFGPLGLAAIRWVPAGDGAMVGELVHSVDGTSISSVPVAGAGNQGLVVAGLGVTADAITVRMVEAAIDGLPGGPADLPASRLLVGTPVD
jgi:hypothetical protein